MSQLILSRGSVYRKNIFKKIFSTFEFGPYFILLSLVLFVGLTTVVTLIFSAQQVTKGYVLNSLDQEHQELIKESEVKDMEISEVRSLKFIQNSTKARRMYKPAQIVYVSGETALAKK